MALALAGCVARSGAQVAPPTPLPTATALVVDTPPLPDAPSTTPALTATIAAPADQATLTPTPEPSPAPLLTPTAAAFAPTPSFTAPPSLPEAAIQILTPGPLSRVTSPLRLRAFLAPGAGGRVQVELLGEDGRLLFRQVLIFSAAPGIKITLFVELEFEIAAVAETGRLQVITADRFGRTTQLESVEIILLSVGGEDLNPPGDQSAPVVIEAPRSGTLIQGGELVISGLARPRSARPLILELIDNQGRILATRLVDVGAAGEADHRPFSTTLPYNVGEPTRVLLTIREPDDRIPGDVHLTSLEVLLGP